MMNHTLSTVFGLARRSVKCSPTLCRQASSSAFTMKPEKHLDTGICCYKNPIRYYSSKDNIPTKQHTRNRHALIHFRGLSSLATGNALGDKDELNTSLEVVEDVPPARYEEVNWADEMKLIKSQESGSVLLPPKDVADIDVLAPELRPSFNLAAYINKSYTLQQLVKLGVDLSKWDGRNGVNNFILPLDFDRDMKPYIVFLHDKGIPADDLGRWLTVNPYIFKENLDNLQGRVDYLEHMRFSSDQIARIVLKNPYWLLFSTTKIDSHLGFFQQSFELTDAEVRYLATKRPQLITKNMDNIKKTTFSVLEEMGFEKSEVKSLLLAKPKIWTSHGVSLLRRFDVAHNTIGLTHSQITKFPQVLLTRDFKLTQRHGFLKLLGRDQYDPLKPNYVSPQALVSGSDADFCINLAKSSVQAFNDYLKTV